MQSGEPGRPSLARLLLGHTLYWAFQLLGWGCVVVLKLLLMLTDPGPDPYSGPSNFIIIGGLALCTHFYRVFIHLAGWRYLNWKELIPRIAIGALVIAVAYSLCLPFIIPIDLIGPPRVEHYSGMWRLSLAIFGCFIFIVAWSGVYFGYHLQSDYQRMQLQQLRLQADQLRLQAALREAEHRTLSAQVNPHFLFNSLNTLRSLITENPDKARDAVTDLARVFRCSLKTSRENLITLREEMEMVNSYLSLEKARFESRLIIHDNIPQQALEAMLPPFLLQILIENAIKYGQGSEPCMEISYSASLSDEGLSLRVTNPGKIADPRDTNSAAGIGLQNSRLRLELLFGNRAFLNLTAAAENTVVAEALIPQLQLGGAV
ncbi:MAG TPA: histidine kinase [Candidatus Methylacidiphilales bacterium]|nr:histidine kinase [Candidatus Methylacidiphilales bacterium]